MAYVANYIDGTISEVNLNSVQQTRILTVMPHPTTLSYDSSGNLWVGGQGFLQKVNLASWSAGSAISVDGTINSMNYDASTNSMVSTILQNGTINLPSHGRTHANAIEYSTSSTPSSYATSMVVNVNTGSTTTSSMFADSASYTQSSVASYLAFPSQTSATPPIYAASTGNLTATATGSSFTVSVISTGKVLVAGTLPYPIRGIALSPTMIYFTMPESNSLVSLPIQLSGTSIPAVQGSTSTTTTLSPPTPADVQPGQAVTMIATVIGTNGSIPSGSVTFSDATQGPLPFGNPVPLVNGVATFNSIVWNGIDSIYAIYSGDTKNLASTSNAVTVVSVPITGQLLFNWPSVNFPQPQMQGTAGTSPWAVTLTNQTGQSLTGLTPTFSGITNFQNGAFTINNTCSTLGYGASCTFDIVPSPLLAQLAGTYSANLVFSGTNGSTIYSSAALPVSGSVVPSFSINWNQDQQTASDGSGNTYSTIDFGPNHTQNIPSSPWLITVYNNTTSTQTLSFSSSIPGAVFSATGSTCTNVAAGSSCTFNLIFTGTAVTTYQGVMTITGSAGGTYSFNTWGQTNTGDFSINWNQDQQNGVSTIDFGPNNTQYITAGPWPITVYNNMPYTKALTLTPSLSVFTIVNNTCGSVPANSSCSFGLDFTPTLVTSYQGTLTIADGSGDSYSFNTWGQANTPGGFAINWNQDQQTASDGSGKTYSTIDFGPNNAQNVTNGPWNITVYNNTPVVQTLTLSPSLSVFTADQSTCTSVPSQGNCNFNLYFTPTADQVYRGTLSISGSAGGYTFNTWGQANR